MRVVVNLYVARPGRATIRKTRRLVYMAMIAKQEGHEVVIHETCSIQPYHFLRHVADYPKECATKTKADLYLCDHALKFASRQDCPVVAYKSALNLKPDAFIAKWASLIVSYTYRQEDWFAHEQPTEPRPWDKKILSVPWLPHEVMLDYFDRLNLTWPYLADDLQTIRERHAAPNYKERLIGFRGQKQRHRSEIAEQCGAGYIFEWAASHLRVDEIKPDINATERLEFQGPQLSCGEYLRWIASCRCILNLPGDTWKCSRHSETVLMGIPLICQRGKVLLAEPLTEQNCIMVDDFADRDAILEALETRSPAIVDAADASYRRGWSLRGQFQTILAKLGLD